MLEKRDVEIGKREEGRGDRKGHGWDS